MNSVDSRRPRRLLSRLGFSVMVLVVLVGLIEGTLRLLPATRDLGKVFVQAEDGSWSFSLADTGISFQSPKPAGVFRIVCFGGSAVEGSIYNPVSTFPNHLRVMLQSLSRSGRVEVINCGKTAATSSIVLDILMESLRYEPDLIVIYSGNNELPDYLPVNRVETPSIFPVFHFLFRHSRAFIVISSQVYKLRLVLGGVRVLEEIPEIDVRINRFPPDRRARIREIYRENIEDMIKAAGEREVPVILCTVAGNLRGWPPNRSRYPSEMTARERLSTEAELKKAEDRFFSGDADQALEIIDSILARAPDHARAYFFRGLLELERGEIEKAREDLVLAQDQDDTGLSRPLYYQNDDLREISRKYDVPLVDVAEIFNRNSPHQISGFELIDDGCHPTIDGQIIIAASLAASIAGGRPGLFRKSEPYELVSNKEKWLEKLDVTDEFLARRTQEMAFYLGFGFEDRMIADRSVTLFNRLKQMTPESTLPDIGIGLISLRLGETERGRQAFETALKQSPQHFKSMEQLYFKHYVRFENPYLWVQAAPGTSFYPILHDYLQATGVVQKGKPFSLPLADADKVYRWEEAAESLVDVTSRLEAQLQKNRKLAARLGANPPPIVLYRQGVPGFEMGLKRIVSAGQGDFVAKGLDPAFIFSGISIMPAAYSKVEVDAVLSPAGEPVQGELCIYWKAKNMRAFAEEIKSCTAIITGDNKKPYHFELSDDPDWIMTDTVDAVRIDPGEGKINIKLNKIEFQTPPG